MKLSLLIPVLNWEETLPETISGIRSLPGGVAHEIVIVFDITAPERRAEIERLRAELTDTYGVHSVVRTSERGFGSALRAGADAATGDVVLPVMADLSDDLAVIPAMLQKIEEGADIVVGARYIRGGAIIGNTAKQRLSRLYSKVISALTEIGCGDISNSFKMYRRDVWQAVSPRSNSFDLSAELVVKGAALGYRVNQVPATWVNRQVGRSNFRLYRELVSYGRWFALSVLAMPRHWLMIAGLGLPYVARQITRRRLLGGARPPRALGIERREQTR